MLRCRRSDARAVTMTAAQAGLHPRMLATVLAVVVLLAVPGTHASTASTFWKQRTAARGRLLASAGCARASSHAQAARAATVTCCAAVKSSLTYSCQP